MLLKPSLSSMLMDRCMKVRSKEISDMEKANSTTATGVSMTETGKLALWMDMEHFTTVEAKSPMKAIGRMTNSMGKGPFIMKSLNLYKKNLTMLTLII